MSQKSVEAFLGRLATDEGFRQRFQEDREAALDEAEAGGTPLTPVERRALLGLDFDSCERFAGALDPQTVRSPADRWRNGLRERGSETIDFSVG